MGCNRQSTVHLILDLDHQRVRDLGLDVGVVLVLHLVEERCPSSFLLAPSYIDRTRDQLFASLASVS